MLTRISTVKAKHTNPGSGGIFGILKALCLLLLMLTIREPAFSNQDTDAAPVAVATAVQRSARGQLELSGTVTSPQAARLSPAIEGLVTSIGVDAGDRVNGGDTLLQLDGELASHALASAEARVRQAEAALEDARRRLKEAEALGSKGGIAETLIENTRTEVSEDAAIVSQYRAEADRQKAVLERHSLKAPFDGVVGQRLVAIGEWITPGQGVFELVATDNLRMDFALPEDYLGQLSERTKVTFVLASDPGVMYPGKVRAVVPVVDPGARTLLLRIVPDNPVPAMTPGMSVKATLEISTGQEALLVPRDAVVRHSDGRITVWTVTGSADVPVATERSVRAAPAADGFVPILEGLPPSEPVIVEGNEALQEGQKVRIVSHRNQD